MFFYISFLPDRRHRHFQHLVNRRSAVALSVSSLKIAQACGFKQHIHIIIRNCDLLRARRHLYLCRRLIGMLRQRQKRCIYFQVGGTVAAVGGAEIYLTALVKGNSLHFVRNIVAAE